MRPIAATGLVLAFLLSGCPRPAAKPAKGTQPPDEGTAATATTTTESGGAEVPAQEIRESPGSFGYAPGEVAEISWTGDPRGSEGPASLKLPTGELLEGTWRAQDSAVADPEQGGRVESTDPRGDPGDPASMPANHPHARQLVIDLLGDRGTKVTCTVPTKKRQVGHCRDEGRRFDARLR